jgi:hypothetical protein
MTIEFFFGQPMNPFKVRAAGEFDRL